MFASIVWAGDDDLRGTVVVPESSPLPGRKWEAVGGVNSDWRWQWQSMEEANRLWEELAEEQPANLDFMQKVRRTRFGMVESIPNSLVRAGCLGAIQETRSRLAKLVHDEPSDRVLRKRLALTCLLLGEIASWEPSVGQSSSFWKEAHDHYKILAEAPGDDILVKVLLADCCRRLMSGQSPDPYYSEAVRMLEQAGRSLAALLKQNPARDWLREALLEAYCELASCHSKVGRNADAAKIVNHDVQPLIAALSEQQADPVSGLSLLRSLCAASGLLQGGQQPTAALAIDRQAAALMLKYAANSWSDPGLLSRLGSFSTGLSATLNQHGDAKLALQMAELARDVTKEASRFAPKDFGSDPQLSDAWQRIGKAHWSLGARDKALAAFRESAALQKRVFQREPSNHISRKDLSKCYDRLVYYGSRGGDLPGAAAALLEREKLWSDDAAELTKIADDFEELAGRVDIRAKGRLSPPQQAEKSYYLAESKRVRDAAKRKGAAGAPPVIGDRS
jgi:tetratricopeptide (TPR) repeat protein